MMAATRTFLSAVVAGVLFATNVVAAEPFRIGVSLALTGGRYDVPAEMQQRGYRLWEKDVNKRGGLMGRKVQIRIVDDQGDKDEVRKAYLALITDHQVDMTFGPYSSALTLAAAAVVAAHRYPMVVAGASADEIWDKGYRNVFGLYAPASRYSKGMLELAQERDLTEVAIIHADDAFSRAAAEGTKKWAGEYDLKIVMTAEFEKGRRDLTDLARAARQKAAKLLVVAGHLPESIDMRTALTKIDWYPSAYFATVGPALPSYHETLGRDAERSFSSSFWHAESNFPGSSEFEAKFKARYHSDPSYHAAAAFAAGQILEEAVELAGSLERDRINDALYELDTRNILGRYGVDKTGMQMKHFALIVQWQDGKKKIVWPKGYLTAEPLFR